MKKELRERIMKEGTVDTRNYRYTTQECRNYDEQWLEIQRIKIEYLNTTAVLDKNNWETVEVIK